MLESKFDVVDTFNQLEDWAGTRWGDVLDSSDMPNQQNDGSESIWGYYSYWGSNPPLSTPKWIKARESENVWLGTGKSLALDWGGKGEYLGPSRLGAYLGNGDPSSGYDEIYIFYMVKANKEVFPWGSLPDELQFWNAWKFLEVATGFRDIWNWGTLAEQELCDDDWNRSQARNVYGLNFVMVNIQATSGDLKPMYTPRVAGLNSDGDGEWMYVVPDSIPNGLPGGIRYASVLPMNTIVHNSSWWGIEFHYRLSNPHGADNGLYEIWIYNSDGIVHDHDSVTLQTFKDSPTGHVLNHKINKIVIGGNRLTDEDFAMASQDHVYIDDFVVDNERIGPTYFGLLKVTAPNNLNIVDPSEE